MVKRPLTVEELREAVAIDPMKPDLDASSLVNDMTHALSCCGCLILVDEEQNTVHFTHHSVQHYLLEEPEDVTLADYHVDIMNADKHAGEACVAYLNFGVFDRRLAKARTQGTKIADIPTAIAHHMMPKNKLATKLAALRLLKTPRTDKKTINGVVQRQLEGAAYQSPQHYYFLAYARKWWIWHTKGLEYKNKRMWNMWCRLFTDETGTVEKIWDPQDWAGYGLDERMLDWANRTHHNALVEYMLLSGASNAPKSLVFLKDIVIRKVRENEWDFLGVVLEHLSETEDYDDVRTTLLLAATCYGRLDIIQLCLSAGADLFEAHEKIVLDKLGVTLQAPRFWKKRGPENLAHRRGLEMLNWWSPLAIATANGYTDIVEFIVSRPHGGKGFFKKPFHLPQALLISTAFNHHELALSLLALQEEEWRFSHEDDDTGYRVKVRKQFDVSYMDKYGWTPLMYAVAFSDIALIQLLLAYRATFYKGEGNKEQVIITPVGLASLMGRRDIEQLLLDNPRYSLNQRSLRTSIMERPPVRFCGPRMMVK